MEPPRIAVNTIHICSLSSKPATSSVSSSTAASMPIGSAMYKILFGQRRTIAQLLPSCHCWPANSENWIMQNNCKPMWSSTVRLEYDWRPFRSCWDGVNPYPIRGISGLFMAAYCGLKLWFFHSRDFTTFPASHNAQRGSLLSTHCCKNGENTNLHLRTFCIRNTFTQFVKQTTSILGHQVRMELSKTLGQR